MRVKILAPLALLLALTVPAQARAAEFHGTVIAKQPQRGTLVLAGRDGIGLTVHARTRAVLGSRVSLRGSRLRDGTIRASRLAVLSRTRHALIRGVVVRQLARSTIVATGRSAITIHHRAARRPASSSDHGGLRPGTIADFRVHIDDDDLFENETARIPHGTLGLVANLHIAVPNLNSGYQSDDPGVGHDARTQGRSRGQSP